MALVKEVMCESQIADQDFPNPTIIAFSTSTPLRSSSFVRSNIRIFASMASQIERMIPAIEARVRTIPNDFTIARSMSPYITSAIPAISPETR